MEPDKTDEIKWINLSDINIDSLSNSSRSNLIEYKKKYGNRKQN